MTITFAHQCRDRPRKENSINVGSKTYFYTFVKISKRCRRGWSWYTGATLQGCMAPNLLTMIQRFLMKRMLKSQLKNMPEDQQNKILALVEKHPDLFKKIAKEVEHKTKKEGKDQMSATMVVMQKYQKELQQAMMDIESDAK